MNNRPHGSELLAVARRTLIDDLLPLLPSGKRYEALMVANAMAIAARELEQRGRAPDPAAIQILQFYRLAGLDDKQDATEHGLAMHIREKSIPESGRELLHRLLLSLTRAKLAISNPKHLDK